MNKEQYAAWRGNPLTEEVFKHLQAKCNQLKDMLANGSTLSNESADATAIQTARLVGNIEGLKEVMLTPIDLGGEDAD